MPKKKYQVIKATTRDIPGVMVGGRVRKFAKNGTFETTDPGEAAEIDKVLGRKGTGEVVVTNYVEKEPGHNYTFRGVDTSNIRTVKDNGYGWYWIGNRQVRLKRAEAEKLGYERVKEKK